MSNSPRMHARRETYLVGTFDESARKKAMALHDTEAFRHSRRLRRKVEMLFAHMKQHLRFNRLRLRGLAGAAEEFMLLATVQDLRKLVKPRPPVIPNKACAPVAWRTTIVQRGIGAALLGGWQLSGVFTTYSGLRSRSPPTALRSMRPGARNGPIW
jgi:hypothetical protein